MKILLASVSGDIYAHELIERDTETIRETYNFPELLMNRVDSFTRTVRVGEPGYDDALQQWIDICVTRLTDDGYRNIVVSRETRQIIYDVDATEMYFIGKKWSDLTSLAHDLNHDIIIRRSRDNVERPYLIIFDDDFQVG